MEINNGITGFTVTIAALINIAGTKRLANRQDSTTGVI